MSMPIAKSRNDALDGLRGVAILAVLLHHCCQLPFNESWNSFITFGYFGSEFFLVLSGYFMTFNLLKVRQGSRSLKSVYLQRFLRLAPLYFLAFLLMVLLCPFFASSITGKPVGDYLPPLDSIVCYLACSANVSVAQHGCLNLFEVTWTLNVQEQFFALWIPLMLWLPRAWLTPACVISILIGVASRPIAANLGMSPTLLHMLTPFRIDAIAFGCLIAILNFDNRLVRMPRIGGVTLIATAVFAVTLIAFPLHNATWYIQIGYTLIGLIAALWLLTGLNAHSESRLGRALSHPWLRWYGRRSYAIFLFHYPIYIGLIAACWLASGKPYQPGMMAPSYRTFALGLLTISVCFPMAWVIWRVIEVPMDRVRERLSRQDFVTVDVTTANDSTTSSDTAHWVKRKARASLGHRASTPFAGIAVSR